MIKIETNIVLTNFKGEPLTEKDGSNINIGVFIADILAFHTENPSRCWQLGKKFSTEKEVELKAEDIVFIKGAIERASTGEKAFKNAMACGQVLEILDGIKSEK